MDCGYDAARESREGGGAKKKTDKNVFDKRGSQGKNTEKRTVAK